MPESRSPAVDAAVESLRRGGAAMIFDSGFREAETDLVFAAQFLTSGQVRRLRQQAGGLLFLAIGHEVGEAFDLPFLEHLYDDLRDGHGERPRPSLAALKSGELPYDARSAFSLSINHRETFTGIPDKDRCKTSRRFTELAAEALQPGRTVEQNLEALGAEFRSPGHIAICREVEGGLRNRRGHTELMVAAARLAGLTPVVLGAEILEQDGENALPIERSRAFARDHGIPLVEGEDLVRATLG
jgi:3,4-dihydroxy 2-butanone 4-phosphate synthase